MAPKLIAVLLLVSVALALRVEAPEAQAARAFVGAPATDPRVSNVSPNDPRLLRADPRDPRALQAPVGAITQPPREFFGHRPPVVIVTQPLVIGSAPCWMPGHWEYQWVPQTSSYSAWMPGQWSPDGQWIEGHYESGVTSSGSWQPFWVSGAWAC